MICAFAGLTPMTVVSPLATGIMTGGALAVVVGAAEVVGASLVLDEVTTAAEDELLLVALLLDFELELADVDVTTVGVGVGVTTVGVGAAVVGGIENSAAALVNRAADLAAELLTETSWSAGPLFTM
jgi:hypothetical protein